MKPESTPISTKELEERMRPGALSQQGFLGKTERLEEVLKADAQTLKELGLSYEEVADRLEALIRVADESRSHRARIEQYLVEVEVFTGFQICPWSPDIHHSQCTAGGGVRYGSISWSINNLRTGQKMSGPGLAIHLIKTHHFFEGFASPYRVDPRALARLLGLGPFKP